MKYEQLMLEEVRRYLNDETYDYALMIGGEWGSGKTYFVKEVLTGELNAIKKDGIDNRVRYYSVCGVESLSEFKETMIYDLLERKADELHEIVAQDMSARRAAYEAEEDEAARESRNPVEQNIESKKKMVREIIEEQREERKNRFASLKSTRAFKIGVDIGGKMVTGLLKSRVPFLNAVDAGDYLSDVEDLHEYVFIFDDIERCSFSVSALLGFINELVEHVHAKVILVVNEQALVRKEQGRRINGEYMEYLGIKEKLVGTVLGYRSDDPEVFEKLIRNDLAEGSLFRESALRLVPEFCSMREETHRHNLRTFQFFLSRVKSIEEQLKAEMSRKGDAKGPDEKAIDRMLPELFGICMDLREAGTSPAEKAEKKEYRFRSLADYVGNGILDVESLMRELQE